MVPKMKLESKAFLLRVLVSSCLLFPINLMKNGVRIVIGRTPISNAQNGFLLRYWRLYLRGVFGFQKIDRITSIASTAEGAGSQALRMMHAINVSRAYGLIYIHTPFSEIAHADRPMREWIDAWESHFNLGRGEIVADCPVPDIVNYDYIWSFDLNRLLGLDAPPVRLSEVTISEIRQKYYSDKHPRNNEVVTICVHIRRGDVTSDTCPEIWVPTESIARTLSVVRAPRYFKWVA